MRRRLKRFFRRLLLAVIGLCLIAGAVQNTPSIVSGSSQVAAK